MSEFRPRDQHNVVSTGVQAVYCESCFARGEGLVETVVLPENRKIVRIKNSFPGFFALNRRSARERLKLHCRSCGTPATFEPGPAMPDEALA